MTTVLDYEQSHQALARLLDNVAEAVHEPDDCPLCADLDVRRHLHGLAEQIRAAIPQKVNDTPHEHGPKPVDPLPEPEPEPPPPPPPPTDQGATP